jgi:murein DD-endopeptidase MepM/ murein hydrolase activator NlpD
MHAFRMTVDVALGTHRVLARATTATTSLLLVVLLNALAACTHIAPMQPRGGITAAPVPVSATDAEYFEVNALMVPVDGVAPDRVSDTFNATRDGGGRMHRATDILAPMGTRVLAATAGKILRLSQSRLGGITIYMLDESERFLYYYAHLDRYADRLTVGQHVRQGDMLGYVGATGNADRREPHLHFQAMRWDPSRHDYWNGAPVDVRPFFTLIGKEREE